MVCNLAFPIESFSLIKKDIMTRSTLEVFILLLSFQRGHPCHYTNNDIAAYLSMSPSQVSKAISKLTSLNMVLSKTAFMQGHKWRVLFANHDWRKLEFVHHTVLKQIQGIKAIEEMINEFHSEYEYIS
jgi:predicted transcriptional regulator